MKHPILLLLITLPLLILIGCTSVPSDSGKTESKTETTSESEECSDMISLSYYFHHGSMAGQDYNYTISKEQNGTYQFHAELESGARTVDKEISKEKFDAITQMFIDKHITKAVAEPEHKGDGYILLDANSSYFNAVFADEHMLCVNLSQSNSEIVSQLKELLNK